MSFLFEPVSAAINTLKYIKSASDKGPDPNRFVTRVPPHPGKWALCTAFKRKHNLWKWTHYLPATVPRKQKPKKKESTRLKIMRGRFADPDKSADSDPDAEEELQLQDASRPKIALRAERTSDAASKLASESATSVLQQTRRDSSGGASSTGEAGDAGRRKSTKEGSYRGSSQAEPPLDEDGMPYFHLPEDDETESEARRIAGLSPEQRVYHRSCEHFKVKPSRQVMKQIDSMEIALAHTKMRDMEFKAFTTGLVMNFTVKRLDLTDTMPSERQMTYLTDFLEDDNGITDLILRENRLEGRAFALMFESMRLRDVMVYLDISGNNIRDKDLPALAAYLETSSQLSYLHMARNKLTSKAGEALAKMMAQASLLELNVSANQLRGEGMIAFLNGVARNSTMERLDISWNGIGPGCVRALCNLIRQSTSLTSLDLTGTRINGECLDLISTQGLSKNGILQRIELKNNPLTTHDLTTFFNRLYANTTTGLRRVDLGDYQMLDSSIVSLLDNLFWEKNIDIRAGPTFSYSKRAETVENIVQRLKQDTLALVTRLDRSQRTALVKYYSYVDMEEAIEMGHDIQATSFLGRVNENKVTYKDLAFRIAREGGNPRDVIQKALVKAKETEGSNRRIATRFSVRPEEARKLNIQLSRTT